MSLEYDYCMFTIFTEYIKNRSRAPSLSIISHPNKMTSQSLLLNCPAEIRLMIFGQLLSTEHAASTALSHDNIVEVLEHERKARTTEAAEATCPESLSHTQGILALFRLLRVNKQTLSDARDILRACPPAHFNLLSQASLAGLGRTVEDIKKVEIVPRLSTYLGSMTELILELKISDLRNEPIVEFGSKFFQGLQHLRCLVKVLNNHKTFKKLTICTDTRYLELRPTSNFRSGLPVREFAFACLADVGPFLCPFTYLDDFIDLKIHGLLPEGRSIESLVPMMDMDYYLVMVKYLDDLQQKYAFRSATFEHPRFPKSMYNRVFRKQKWIYKNCSINLAEELMMRASDKKVDLKHDYDKLCKQARGQESFLRTIMITAWTTANQGVEASPRALARWLRILETWASEQEELEQAAREMLVNAL